MIPCADLPLFVQGCLQPPFLWPPSEVCKSEWGPGAITVSVHVPIRPIVFSSCSSEDSAVAHCLLSVRPSRKNNLLNFHGRQAMRPRDLKVFFFDRHRGAVFFTLCRAELCRLEGAEKNVYAQPVWLRNTPNNRGPSCAVGLGRYHGWRCGSEKEIRVP
jgi:hypothetical protein